LCWITIDLMDENSSSSSTQNEHSSQPSKGTQKRFVSKVSFFFLNSFFYVERKMSSKIFLLKSRVFLLNFNCRFSPTRTPSPWDGIRKSDRFSAVCPQHLPDIANEQEALKKMPKGRLEYLKRLLPFLRNQSEDCLYMNIFSPLHGMFYD
jgi:hypothetical protein